MSVLQLFAKVVRETMRADDVIGRLGGEEFVAILPGTLADAAGCRRARARGLRCRRASRATAGAIAATVSVGCGMRLAVGHDRRAHRGAPMPRSIAPKRMDATGSRPSTKAIAAAPERLEAARSGRQAGNFECGRNAASHTESSSQSHVA